MVQHARDCQSCDGVVRVSVSRARSSRGPARCDPTSYGSRLHAGVVRIPPTPVPLCRVSHLSRRPVPSRDVCSCHGCSVHTVRKRSCQRNAVCHFRDSGCHHLHRHRVAAAWLDASFRTTRLCPGQPVCPSSTRRLDQRVLPLHANSPQTSRACRVYSGVSVDLQCDWIFSTGARQGTARTPKKIRPSNEQCE